MSQASVSLKQDQTEKYKSYQSLDLQNKIYQIKAFTFITESTKPGNNILELGCADGSFLSYIKEKTNSKVFGLDVSSHAIKKAREKSLNVQVHNLEKVLPFQTNRFDLVICLEVIEHLYDTDFLLSQIHRVLKPGGFLVLSTPNLASLPNRFRLLLNKYPKYLEYSRDGAGHIHLYTLPVLLSQIQKNGFVVEKKTSPNITCPFITKSWFPKPIKQFAMILGDIYPSLGSHLVIKAQKA